jgi:NADH-quinone oxidoreductase subunit J
VIGFTILGLILVMGSIQVIRCKDLVHGVLWLALTLMTTAATFAYLDAGFVAGIQVLLYTGGVVILMLFAVMLTKRLDGASIRIDSDGWLRASIVGFLLFAGLAAVILNSPMPNKGQIGEDSLQKVGALFLTRHLAAFEILSILLLAAMVGAIVIARKKDA